MKSLFKTTINPYYADLWLLLLRICIASFMLSHGIPKLKMLIAGGEITFADPLGIGVMASLYLTVFAEFFCSILIFFGFATRIASFVLIITMAVAAFVVHSGDPFKEKELALLYLVVYFILLFFGAGKYSLDSFIAKPGSGFKEGKDNKYR